MKIFVAGLLLVLLSAPGHAASFDCGQASGNVEKLVCADKELSMLDTAMGAAFKQALASTNADARKELVREQKAWLRESRSLCGERACLKRAYQVRLARLRQCGEVCVDLLQTYEKNGEEYNLLIPRNANRRNASFTDDLLKRGLGRLAGCESLVQVAVGTASGNNSFGGICKIGERKTARFVLVCNDDMVGHFKLAPAAPALTQKQLIDFTIDNCFGG